MPRMIQAKIVNGALVPLEPLGIEEGANVVFELVAKAPPGVAPNMRDYLGYAKMKTPSEIDEELFIEGYLAKERRIRESEPGKFRAGPPYSESPTWEVLEGAMQILKDEDDARYRRLKDKAE